VVTPVGPSTRSEVAEYLGALQIEQGASRNTLLSYRHDLGDFVSFLGDRRCPVVAVEAEDVVAYLERLKRGGLKPASVARRLSAVRGLLRHLVREGALARDPTEHLERPRLPRPLPRTLSREAATALVEAPDIRRPTGFLDR
jgi:integrase/recombinase XerD